MDELIRPIRWADLSAYQALLEECFSQGLGKEETLPALLRAAQLYSRAFPLLRVLSVARILPRSVPRVYVCLRDARLAGAFCIRRKAPGAYYVVHLAVSREYRRLGIATRLRDYAVSRLPDEPGLRLLARHRRQNEPQIGNATKFGYRPYLREYTMFLPGEALTQLRERLGAFEFEQEGVCRPKRHDIRRLRLREIPVRALDLDPTLAEPDHEHAGVMHVLNSFALESWSTEQALKRDGRMLGAVRIFYHRLQKTYAAEFVLDPDADEAVLRELGRVMIEALAPRQVTTLRVRVWDFQPSLKEFLLTQGFQELVERILVSCYV